MSRPNWSPTQITCQPDTLDLGKQGYTKYPAAGGSCQAASWQEGTGRRAGERAGRQARKHMGNGQAGWLGPGQAKGQACGQAGRQAVSHNIQAVIDYDGGFLKSKQKFDLYSSTG